MSDADPLASWGAQSPPTPRELAREMANKRGVLQADATQVPTAAVEITLAERFGGVPCSIARPIYRRGLRITDVSTVANSTHLCVTVQAPEGRQ